MRRIPGANVLIVDDDEYNRKLLNIFISTEGHKPIEAASAQEAVQRAEADHPDIILLDLMMPGVDGFELARQLKGNPRTADIPLVVVSALDDPAVAQRAISCGVDGFVQKPLDRWQLLQTVNGLLTVDTGATPGTDADA